MFKPRSAIFRSNLQGNPMASYCSAVDNYIKEQEQFSVELDKDIKVIELFAGVGGFRIGLERASEQFKTVWSSQWEPSTKKQDASEIYVKRFGADGHSNENVCTVGVERIPEADMVVGGFPCQDYSVASTLNRSGGIEGKKGVLWWEIYRILKDSEHKPSYCIFENVDRLLKSPAKQRGRDFAIILASLANLGYDVEWRVINAADYGMPQCRRRTYMVAYKNDEKLATKIRSQVPETVIFAGVIGAAFPASKPEKGKFNKFSLDTDLVTVSNEFNKGKKTSPFFTAGVLRGREVTTVDVVPQYDGTRITLGDILVDEKDVPESFFIKDTEMPRWQYLKGGKSEKRVTADGFEYNYSEGPMAFPDSPEKPSRTIITGEGGTAPSRFKHVVQTPSGRYRRLMPIELERLNMFPDNHTEGVSDIKRAFLMGNALVTGIVSGIGRSLALFVGHD